MLLRFLFLVLLMLPSLGGTAQAAEYAETTWPNLARAMVRFNTFDLSDPVLLDEYTIITECDLYKAFYQDDFKWNQVRQAVVQSAKINLATYPTNFHYDTKLQLDRYDFPSKIFRFTDKSVIHNVNTFTLYSVTGTGCGAAEVKHLPRTFRGVIAVPIYMDGLPLGEKDGQALLALMDADQNDSRIVYVRFNLAVTYIEPLRKVTEKTATGITVHYGQSNTTNNQDLRLDMRLDSIEFFEDEKATRLIYRYQP